MTPDEGSGRTGASPASDGPLRLHFVRHGETAESRELRFCGDRECGLTADGRLMARLIADRCMGGGDWRAIYVSPLARARETAQPAAEALGLTLQVEPGLREIAHGVFEGLLEEEARSQYPEAFVAYERHPGLEAPPGGESGYAVAARALPVVEKIRVEHRSGDVLIVSHKATIRVLVSALLGLDVDLYRARLAQPVGTFTTLELTPQGWLLRALADACHLDPALRRAGGI